MSIGTIYRVVLLFFLLLVTPAASYAAPPVEGFMGVPWGASREQVEAAMAGQGFVRLPRPDFCSSVPNNSLCDPALVNYDGRFGGERAEIRFSFQNRALYEGWVWLTLSQSQSLSDQVTAYTRMKALLTGKYGSPTTDTKYTRPKGGGESAKSTWLLSAGESGDQVEIVLLMEGVFTYSITSSGYVHVFYINRSLQARLNHGNI